MALIEPVIRPPSEAHSLLLQVTLGCSQNSCTFCGAYQGKKFKIKSNEEIIDDIKHAAALYPETRRVFLCDGDALVLNNQRLLPILQELHNYFPKLNRISSYANADNILRRSASELEELSAHKLKLIFIGLESGSNKVLKRVNKTATADEMILAVQKANEAGIKSNVIVLLGLGEKRGSFEHAKASAQAVNAMNPRYLSALSLMLIPGTKLYEENIKGTFDELSPQELLQETYWLLEDLKVKNTIFRCNHASNYIPLEGRLPQDKEMMLQTLKAGMHGDIALRPELLRGL